MSIRMFWFFIGECIGKGSLVIFHYLSNFSWEPFKKYA